MRVLWLCRGFVFPLLQTGCRFPVAGFAAAAPPTWGEHTLHQSVASASSSGTGSPRTVSLSLPTPGRSPYLACSIFVNEDSLGIKESNRGLSEVSS